MAPKTGKERKSSCFGEKKETIFLQNVNRPNIGFRKAAHTRFGIRSKVTISKISVVKKLSMSMKKARFVAFQKAVRQ